MKFSKQIADDAVPEWRSQYFNYKQGKKKVKAVAKAVRNVPSQDRSNKPTTPGSSLFDAPVFSLLRPKRTNTSNSASGAYLRHVRTHSDSEAVAPNEMGPNIDGLQSGHTRPITIPINERSPLQNRQAAPLERPNEQQRMTSYGSIIGSPPHSPLVHHKRQAAPPSLELPAPAVIDQASNEEAVSPTTEAPPSSMAAQLAHRGNAYEIRPPFDALARDRANSASRGPFYRLFSVAGQPSQRIIDGDVALEAYKEIDFRKADYFMFLDKELSKIESFYKVQEDHVLTRLDELRQHLHRLRESRALEVAKAAALPKQSGTMDPHSDAHAIPHDISSAIAWITNTVQRHRPGHVGKTSRAMSRLGSPNLQGENQYGADGSLDYVRRHKEEVTYRTAKKKLKLALQAYYQDLERLKDFALLNRTAFRKITKKYAKRTGLTTTYMDTYVNKAHFVTSQDIDHLLAETEDLYSRYFERGNKKIAISKLRSDSRNKKDLSAPAARTSALLTAGAIFGVIGLVSGADDLFHPPRGYDAVRTSYLLQIYGGYFMILFLAFLFTACVYWFHRQKVNYAFIFELNRRNSLHWQELVEIPAWFWFILALAMYFNFALKLGGPTMYVYWPVVLVGIAVIMLFLPAPFFFYRQRLWLATVLWRLLTASTVILTPDVEFRDLFIGDMFCSLTYATGNVELFFCLYSLHWENEAQCNSSNSWVLGLFSALPGFWRASQCLKRYWVSGEWFPNLVNLGKYTATMMQYVTLSMYRINKDSYTIFAVFILFASINTVYCSIWDIAMDWSLGDSQHHYLRRTLIYRKQKWMYYAAMVIDPIIRANWIFYAVFTKDAQHSTIVSFMVALSEALRRGIWVLFRVENEQARNTEALKASKDLPLPYNLHSAVDEEHTPESSMSPTTPPDAVAQLDGTGKSPQSQRRQQQSSRPTTMEEARAQESPVQTFLRRVGTEMRTAHTRDYQRRTPRDEAFAQDDEDDDEDDDDDDDDDSDAE